jgi:hypothetical protein
MHDGAQALVLWKDRQYATNRMRYTGGALSLTNTGLPRDSAAEKAMRVPGQASDRTRWEQTFPRFCAIFPDAFFVSERARVYLDQAKEKQNVAGRLLSAGFHSQMGYFRDDAPLSELMLDVTGRRTLDRLWRELDFVTSAPIRQYRNFLWFERADSPFLLDREFDFARPEDKDSTSDARIRQLAEVYLAKVRRATTNPVAIEVVREHFVQVSQTIRHLEQDWRDAEPSHLEALVGFAERAYRRPLTAVESGEIRSFYQSLRTDGGLDHENAVRDSVVSILMSPHFAYRVDAPTAERGVYPLSDQALASRLSYFLWSSMPDAELLSHAAAGDLHQPAVLLSQTRRLLRDPRVRGLATEFAGNWLDFRRFEEHNAVDRERFKTFNPELRSAMFEEPIRFFNDVIQSNRSLLDFLDARDTFVNPVLAQHYAIPGIPGGSNDWTHLLRADPYQRGGLLPMAVFLTKNAPGLRTSPVKRGYWVARRLLGERIPPPPAAVPELPADEAKLGEQTLREALARHRDDPNCAGCHARFDSLGLVFEGFGPIGDLRDHDLAGHPVDVRATFPGGTEGAGIDGLRTYLRDHRQNEFLENFTRKLFAYALGRGLMLADEPALRTFRTRLAADQQRIQGLIESIVTSPQFLTQRGREELSKN